MIEVGLTSVADHPELSATGKKVSTFSDYASHFPVVEIDTMFYGVKSESVVAQWQQQVPAQFQFIVKAPGALTQHRQKTNQALNQPTMFAEFVQSLTPLIATNQLTAVLFQFPPYFGVSGAHVHYLRSLRQQYPHLPLAVEFRHSSWYAPQYRASTLDLLRQLELIHVVVDEPQTPGGSVPMVPVATNSELTMMRLHGRNTLGWATQQRPERTDYQYSEPELAQLGTVARQLDSKRVVVIFNNNGGGAAAGDAKAFIDLLGLDFPGLGPAQLDLF
ncbi:DUF72 domain-containing protein [Lacticaseibacillus brantae]|uniref:DUF72 domain-containing protein n=1 Tax=Lacticaseibacillus brantae TaxID=943673 RepID=UPI00070FE853|nr:DUF72 domain-containing protein [Lacticaseibacillus brantae]